MTYAQAVAALEGALKFGIHPSLDGIRRLTDALGRPQDAMRFVQVTGTNGKSSVTRMTAALLAAEGLRAAAYTSPHLEHYIERMELGGSPVSREDFARAVAAALSAGETAPRAPDGDYSGYTEFELLTAAALWLFRELRVEWAVLEVGMGGRWDATSVVEPEVAAVTSVGLDHTDRLGTTVEDIAADKAQIVKRPGSTTVLGPVGPAVEAVVAARAAEIGSRLVRVAQADAEVVFRVTARPSSPGAKTRLDVRTRRAAYEDLAVRAPSYQAPNAAVAVAAAEAALGRPLDRAAVRSALEGMTFPGRFEVVRSQPPLVLDGAHNPQAASVLASAIREAFPAEKPVALIGVLADKDAEGIVRALADDSAGFVATRSGSHRALFARDLAEIVQRVTGRVADAEEDLALALEMAVRLGGDAGVVVTGSLYTVGETRALLGL